MSSPDDPVGLFASMFGGDDKVNMAILAEKQLDILLKYTQLLYYAHELADDKMLQQLERKVKPMIELLTENMDQATRDYQSKHGEI